MDTLEMAIIIYFVLCLQMGLTAVALNIAYKRRLPSSKGTQKLKLEGDQQEESAHEEKIKSRSVLKRLSGRGIHKRAISFGRKPLKPGPAANEVPPAKNTAPVGSSKPSVALKDDSVSHTALPGTPRGQSAIIEPKSREKPAQEPTAGNTRKRKGIKGITFLTRKKAGEQIEITEAPKQAQPKNTAPVESSEPSVAPVHILTSPIAPQRPPATTEAPKQTQPKNTAPVESSEPSVAVKDDSLSHTAFPVAPQRPPATTEAPKQAQPKNTAPVESSEPSVALKDDSVSHTAPPVAPQLQSARPEAPKQAQPKNAAPVKSSEPMVPAKTYTTTYTVNITTPPGTPQGQSARTEPKSREKPAKGPTADNTSGGEKNELSGTVEPAKSGPGVEVNQASSEPSAATTDSGETDQESPQTNNSGLGDLADLFATSASEFTEKNRLSEQVKDVDVNELLKEGLGLLDKVKKKSDG